MADAGMSHSAVAEVEVAAHTILLPRGTYCVYVVASSGVPDDRLPGLGVSAAPGEDGTAVEVARLAGEPWLRRRGDGVLVRVHAPEVRLLLTSYNQARILGAVPPKVEVQRLDPPPTHQTSGKADGKKVQGTPVRGKQPRGKPAQAGKDRAPAPVQLSVHVRNRGDQAGRFGEWVGDERGGDAWIEGFTIPLPPGLAPGDLEYQAVLGKGWLSPWVAAGEYCGSRGMQLPVLGVHLRLNGDAARKASLRVSATFADGSAHGPVGAGTICAADPLRPVVALRVEVKPASTAAKGARKRPPADAKATRGQSAGRR